MQYRKLTAGHPVSPQHDFTGKKPFASYFITGSCQPGVQAPEQSNANCAEKEMQKEATVVWGTASVQTKEPREESTALDCCQEKSAWGGRWTEGIASKPKREQSTLLRPKDTEISC